MKRLCLVLAVAYAALIGWHAIELYRDRLTWSLSPDVIRSES